MASLELLEVKNLAPSWEKIKLCVILAEFASVILAEKVQVSSEIDETSLQTFLVLLFHSFYFSFVYFKRFFGACQVAQWLRIRFSLQWLSTGSVHVAFSSCGTWAQ